MEHDPTTPSGWPADHFVLDVGDESQDDALIDGIIAWIEKRDPEFFLPDED